MRQLREHHALDAAPHMSCMGGSREEIRTLLQQYNTMGCRRIVALRGDMPSGMATYGDIRYACELVEFIRAEFDGAFHIEVACYPEMHPQSDDSHADLKNFDAKVKAGANGAITQYFFNADAYFRFVDEARSQASTCRSCPASCRFRRIRSCAVFPTCAARKFRAGSPSVFEAFRDDADSIREFGADVVADLCRKLVAGGAPGMHFYTFNRARATLAVTSA